MKKQTQQEEKIVQWVLDDFANRQNARKNFETQWQMNLNFYMGNQYCEVGYNGQVEDLEKQYFWQEREIFNHIAPTIDIRVAKLGKIRPNLRVLPASNDDSDVYSAQISKKILESVATKFDLSHKMNQAMLWSEICGTSFYKVSWNPLKGDILAKNQDGSSIKSGEVEISVCSPFEIYPDSFTCENIENCQSIIHARAMDVDKIRSTYKIDVDGGDINIYSLSSTSIGVGGLGYSSSAAKISQGIKKNSAIVIERYEQPSNSYLNGRLTIVVGTKLYYDGEIPFAVGIDGKRTFPFIKQTSINQIGSFWGNSIIDRLIPVQRAYNAVKNRKHEFMNRLTMGVLAVEDGSIDLENLEDEGLCPGKILVYRQGSNLPEFLEGENLSSSFNDEETKLLEEVKTISGVSDFMNESKLATNMSGVALELMLEQDELRLSGTADNIKSSLKQLGKLILRLYKQYASLPRVGRIAGENGKVELFYFNNKDISSDDIQIEAQNELGESLTQRREMIFSLISAGLLNDQDGGMSNKMKAKALSMLGLGVWENAQETNELHKKRADGENLDAAHGKEIEILEIDDHAIHIDRHVSFVISGECDKFIESQPSLKNKLLKHIQQHKEELCKKNTGNN